jgi:hypothetical protein
LNPERFLPHIYLRKIFTTHLLEKDFYHTFT